MFDDRREEMARVHETLRTAGLVAPLDLDDPEDVRRWVHCDLASMVEGCFDVRLDPLALGQAERDAWLGRLRGSYRLPDPRREDTWNQEWFGHRYWLLDGGAPVGTVQIPLTLTARRLLSVNSLYVLPPHRRRGAASGILEALDDAARRQSIPGIRIDAHWTWHRSIRFYLARELLDLEAGTRGEHDEGEHEDQRAARHELAGAGEAELDRAFGRADGKISLPPLA